MSENVTITKDQLEWFIRQDRELSALEAAGVDNWIGWEDVEFPSEAEIANEVAWYCEVPQ